MMVAPGAMPIGTDAVVARGDDACYESRVGESVRILILVECEPLNFRDRACNINAAGQIDVSVVEPAIDDGHPNARTTRACVPGLRSVNGFGSPLRREKGLVVPDARALDSGGLAGFPGPADALAGIDPANYPVLSYRLDARNRRR